MLNDYVQHNPTKIVFGRGCEERVANEVRACGGTRALVHYDAGEFILPLVARVRELLAAAGLEVFELGGVVPNPKVSLMREGCRMVRENNIDFVLAVGGGSTMDSAKYIACGAHYEGDLWNHPKSEPIATRVLRHGVVLTMPGTGSEVSAAAVWRDDTCSPEKKVCVFAEEMRFDFALIDPVLTFTLPAFQTAAGCFDIISHAMEDYFCAPEGVEFYLAAYERVINEVKRSLPVALANPRDYNARANICRVAYVPLEDVIISGQVHGYCVHNLEKPMTAAYHRTHGEMLAILFPAWMRYCYERNLPLFARLCVNCFGARMDYGNPRVTILEGIGNLEHFIEDVGLPTRLGQVGIGPECFEDCADAALEAAGTDHIGSAIRLDREGILGVYRLAE